MNDRHVLQDARKLRALLADPKHWTKRVLARDSDGFAVQPDSPHATCWCLVGGMQKVTTSFIDLRFALFDRLPPNFKSGLGGEIGDFNDSLHHDQLLAWLDGVIADMERA